MKAKKLIINGEEHELVSSVNGQTGDIIIDKSNTKTFFLASDQDLATAQEVLDRMKNGNHPIIIYDDEVYIYDGVGQTKSREKVTFKSTKVSEYTDTATGYTDMISKKIELDYDGDTRQIYSIWMDIQTQSPHTLDTYIDYPYPYDPVYPGSPTTKRYVDKHDTMVSATAPSNPTEGMVWYDTTNDVLKVYNGTTWDTIATGGAISDTAYASSWNGVTGTAPSKNAVYDKISAMDTTIAGKQDTLVSGTSIKTINSTSLLGSGDIAINGTVVSASTPASPTEGMVWYDTTNDVLKTYNGSSWDEAGAESNTKTFTLSGTTGQTALDDATAIYAWRSAGNTPIVKYLNTDWYWITSSFANGVQLSSFKTTATNGTSTTTIERKSIDFIVDGNGNVTSISTGTIAVASVLNTGQNYSTPYTPQYNGSPATKKYVDDAIAFTISTQANNILTSGVPVRAGTQANYDNLGTYDNNGIYFII